MDPVLQTFQQQQSGSAEGQGFGNFFAQGRQFNLSQQHLDLQKKAEARAQREQDSLLGLQKQLLENQAIMTGAALGGIETASKVKADMATAVPLMNDLQYKIQTSPEGFASDAAYETWLKLQNRYPWLPHTKNGTEIDLGFKSAHMRSIQALEAKEADLAGARGFNYATPQGRAGYKKQKAWDEIQKLAASPEYQRSFKASMMKPGWYDPETGHYDPEIVAASLEEMPRSEKILSAEEIAAWKVAASTANGGIEPETRTITDPDTGQQVTVYRTGPRSWARVPKTLDNPRATTLNNPVTGNPEAYVQTGPNNFSRIPMSTGEQQLVQTEIASGNIFEKGRQLLPLINDRTTSVGSNLKRTLRDSKIGIFLPESFLPSAEVTEADAVAREFMAQVVRGLRSDGNITGKEAQDLMNEANSVHWVNEKTGKARVKAFVQGAVRKAREASLRLGRPINEKYLTVDELGQRAEAKVESGEMTREQAMDWAVKTHLNSADALISDIDQQIGR